MVISWNTMENSGKNHVNKEIRLLNFLTCQSGWATVTTNIAAKALIYHDLGWNP